ncbi:MAG TPA: hypothetical protein DHV86_06220 [Methylophilaceae bacterium]|jgi:4-hydroxybenzoate polyprenyltransferase|nr:hypothetical protein [Methylophilaceae bacterium]
MINSLMQFFKLIRIHQWSKNLLIFVPLLVSPELENILLWQDLILAFFAFSLCSSTSYIINDIIDLKNDQAHPIKKFRPIASGFFTVNTSVSFAILIGLICISLSILISGLFCAALFIYFIASQGYSFKFKKIHLIDCIVLSLLYMMRIIAGALAASLNISIWLLSFSLFFFFSFALLKRYSELLNHASDSISSFGRGYAKQDLPLVMNMGISSAFISILVIGLYFNDDSVYLNYYEPRFLFLLLPILLIWICSIWSRVVKGVEINDPISFALTDRISLIIFFLSAAIFIIARYKILSI